MCAQTLHSIWFRLLLTPSLLYYVSACHIHASQLKNFAYFTLQYQKNSSNIPHCYRIKQCTMAGMGCLLFGCIWHLSIAQPPLPSNCKSWVTEALVQIFPWCYMTWNCNSNLNILLFYKIALIPFSDKQMAVMVTSETCFESWSTHIIKGDWSPLPSILFNNASPRKA